MGKIIAWIEDDIDVIGSVVRPLERAGYKIISIRNAGEALNAVDEIREADLILLDMILPRGSITEELGRYSGVEVLRRLRTQGVQAPALLFTVVTHDTKVQELDKGALNIKDTLNKPIRPSELKEKVERVLAGKL